MTLSGLVLKLKFMSENVSVFHLGNMFHTLYFSALSFFIVLHLQQNLKLCLKLKKDKGQRTQTLSSLCFSGLF